MVAIQVWWCFWCSPYMVKINIKSHLTEAVPENSIGFIFVLFISVLIKVTSSLYDHCHAAFFSRPFSYSLYESSDVSSSSARRDSVSVLEIRLKIWEFLQLQNFTELILRRCVWFLLGVDLEVSSYLQVWSKHDAARIAEQNYLNRMLREYRCLTAAVNIQCWQIPEVQ